MIRRIKKTKKNHNEAILAAKTSIHMLREMGLPVTPTSVACAAGIARGNLYSRAGRKNEDWNDIIRMMRTYDRLEIDGDMVGQKAIRKLRINYEELLKRIEHVEKVGDKVFKALLDNYVYYWQKDKNRADQIENYAEILEELNNSKQYIYELEVRLRMADAQKKNSEKPKCSGDIVPFSRKIIISMESLGVFEYNEAMQEALNALDEKLHMPGIGCLYLVCGESNKEVGIWARKHVPVEKGISIYFAATVSKASDRAKIIQKAKKAHCKIVCTRVVSKKQDIDIDFEPLGCKIPVHTLESHGERFEEVAIYEGYDSILIIKEDSL